MSEFWDLWENGNHPMQAEVHEPIHEEYQPAEYVICNIVGDLVGDVETRLDFAIEQAKQKLEDDPELGELTVWEQHPSGNLVTHERTITHGPDADWQSVVVVLKPGEHVQAPGPIPHRITEEDLDGYERDSYKRAVLEEHLGDWGL
jgi:hypothetical protein